MHKALAQLDNLLGRDCSVKGSLDFRDRSFAAGIHKRRDIKGFAGISEYVVGDGTGRLSKTITEKIIKFQVGNSQAVLNPVFSPESMLVSLVR